MHQRVLDTDEKTKRKRWELPDVNLLLSFLPLLFFAAIYHLVHVSLRFLERMITAFYSVILSSCFLFIKMLENCEIEVVHCFKEFVLFSQK